jgi:hypothetical protein
MATFVNNRGNQNMINLRPKPSSNSLLHNNLNFNGLNLEAQNVVIPLIVVNPSTSVIKVFVYEIIIPDPLIYNRNGTAPHTFRKLIQKPKNNESIKSVEAQNLPRSTERLFTQNII